MRRRTTLNYWIAFADIVFVLFVCGLVASVVFRRVAMEKQRLNTRLMTENVTLRRKLARAYRCAAVDPFLKNISSCIEAKLQVTGAVPVGNCSMSLSDELIKFEFNSAIPVAPRRAAAAMQCVYEGISAVQVQRPQEFDGIEALAINGYTDCRGDSLFNMHLGAARAQTLYELIESEIDNDPRMQAHAAERDKFMRKLVIRSYGENRGDPRCSTVGEMPADRRVTISVEMQRDAADQQSPEAE